MKIATLISSIITSLFMLSAMICGLWIKANSITAASSIDFHMKCGVAASVFSVITLTLLIIQFVRTKKGE